MAENECQRCAGCGQLADDDEATPWKYWMELPVQSAVAVTMGWVKPVPCPECDGSGKAAAIDLLAALTALCMSHDEVQATAANRRITVGNLVGQRIDAALASGSPLESESE